jgi:hypothetical protein
VQALEAQAWPRNKSVKKSNAKRLLSEKKKRGRAAGG